MLQTTTPSTIDRQGLAAEQTFRLKSTSKAFSILSSGLYSNKILAVVRELSCNAWDAHVAAGKNTTPIEVKLPTPIDDTFYVKDFGIGLSHEQVLNIYTTYFESTKTDSNDFIGALGLGSKSPFSYTNTFIVESRFNAIKRVYTAFINEAGIPAIALMGEESTDECNGVTIMFSVKPSDRRAFAEAAAEALSYFNPTPVLKGTADNLVEPIKFRITGNAWNVRHEKNSQHRGGGVRVVQGFVSYPVDMDQLIEAAADRTNSFVDASCNAMVAIRRIDLDIIVPIGDVEVAASREALSYDKRTVNNLIVVLTKVSLGLVQELQGEINKLPNVWAAVNAYAEYTASGSAFRELMTQSGHKFTFAGKELRQYLTITLTKYHDEIAVEQRCRKYRTSSVEMTARFTDKGAVVNGDLEEDETGADETVADDALTVRIPANAKIIIDDIGVGLQRTLDTWMCSSGVRSAWVFRNAEYKAKKPVHELMVGEVLAQMGIDTSHPSVILLSAIATTAPRAKSTRGKKDPTVFKVWKGFQEKRSSSRYYSTELNLSFSRLTWDERSFDMNSADETGYYVCVERFAVVRNFGITEVDNFFHNVLTHAKQIGVIEDDATIIGVSENDMKKVNKARWKNLFEVIDTEVLAAESRGLYSQVVNRTVRREIDHCVAISGMWANVGAMVAPCELKTFLDALVCKHDNDLRAWEYLLRTCVTDFSARVDAAANKQIDEWRAIAHKFPLLNLLDLEACSSIVAAKTVAGLFNAHIASLSEPV